MYLSDRDLAWAIETGRLIVDPRPESIDPTSLDLHLGNIDDAKNGAEGTSATYGQTGVHGRDDASTA